MRKKLAILLTFGVESLRGISYFSVYGGGGSDGRVVVIVMVGELLANGFSCLRGIATSYYLLCEDATVARTTMLYGNATVRLVVEKIVERVRYSGV